MTGRLDARTLGLLALGVVAVSVAAPLMASLSVGPLAISFWRNALAVVAIAPVVAWFAARDARRPAEQAPPGPDCATPRWSWPRGSASLPTSGSG